MRKVTEADLRLITGMTLQECYDLHAAAINAFNGDHEDAEKCRKYAGYGGLTDPDLEGGYLT